MTTTEKSIVTVQNVPRQQAVGINRRRLGDIVVTLIHDGFQDFSFDLLSNITADAARELLVAAHLPPIPRMSINSYVIQDGKRTALIDGGAGGFHGGGRLKHALAAANIEPSQIDTILLTHAHPDHVGGLATYSATPLFPHAELVVNAAEVDYWRDETNFLSSPSIMQTIRRIALNTFDAYRSVMRTSSEGEVIEGVTMTPLPGHTPGHSGYWIHSGGESLLIWGDIVHWPNIQIRKPDVTLVLDHDPVQAAETRVRLFEVLASNNSLVGGMHLNFPGFIRIPRNGSGYEIREERWSPYLA